MLNGMPVVTIDYLFENGVMPKRKHKKKRVQKKWIKKYGYTKRIIYKFIIHKGTIYCHSKMLKRLEKQYEI